MAAGDGKPRVGLLPFDRRYATLAALLRVAGYHLFHRLQMPALSGGRGDGEPAQFVSRPSDGRNQADSPVVLP